MPTTLTATVPSSCEVVSSGPLQEAGPLEQQQASPAQVRQWLQSGEATLVDVREPDEHASERIAGSVSLPLSRFNGAELAKAVKPGGRVVLHCKSGRRSSDACRMALAGGITVVNMTGGIEAWKLAQLPVLRASGRQPISVMRQVQLVIGASVLAGAALAWFVDPRFVAVPAFFGAGLTFAGATGTCALATIIAKLPWNRAKGKAACSAGSCC
jgi:rhodanese-related sulfurtransferase